VLAKFVHAFMLPLNNAFRSKYFVFAFPVTLHLPQESQESQESQNLRISGISGFCSVTQSIVMWSGGPNCSLTARRKSATEESWLNPSTLLSTFVPIPVMCSDVEDRCRALIRCVFRGLETKSERCNLLMIGFARKHSGRHGMESDMSGPKIKM
jgi:hypothetical protein